jgi:catechol 2,3-dioxygenase-like lactoylglutathione lyase family enzyme
MEAEMTSIPHGTQTTADPSEHVAPSIEGMWGVRYQVKDVHRSIEFYTRMLGFVLDFQKLPAFGQLSLGELKLILSGPGASGSRPLPGRTADPGGRSRRQSDRAVRARRPIVEIEMHEVRVRRL